MVMGWALLLSRLSYRKDIHRRGHDYTVPNLSSHESPSCPYVYLAKTSNQFTFKEKN